MAMWVMAVVGAAPCQCFSPGSNHTTSPGRISSTGPPQRCARPQSSRDDERLTERMRVPCGPRPRLERNAGALDQRWLRRLKKRIDSYRASEPLRRSLGRRLRTNSSDFHSFVSFNRLWIGHFLQACARTELLNLSHSLRQYQLLCQKNVFARELLKDGCVLRKVGGQDVGRVTSDPLR